MIQFLSQFVFRQFLDTILSFDWIWHIFDSVFHIFEMAGPEYWIFTIISPVFYWWFCTSGCILMKFKWPVAKILSIMGYICPGDRSQGRGTFFLHGQVYELKIHLHLVHVHVVHVTIKPRLRARVTRCEQLWPGVARCDCVWPGVTYIRYL